MEDSPINKTYRLTLDFTVWMNDEILHPYSDEDELDEEEKRQLQAQRSLLQALLNDKRGILEELIRKRVLEDADGAVDIYELRERFLLCNVEDEDLLEPIIDKLPRDDQLYLLEAIENSTFKDAAGEAIYSIGVELENVCFVSILYRRRQINLPLFELELQRLKIELRQFSLPKVLFAAKTLPRDFSDRLEESRPYLLVKSVLAAVFMWQRGKVIWR